MRWNGPVGDFTYLVNTSGAQYGVTEGDVVKATIVGNVITAYLNGVQVGTATDATYTTGSPGMGMNLETGDASCVGTNGDYGFKHFTAAAKFGTPRGPRPAISQPATAPHGQLNERAFRGRVSGAAAQEISTARASRDPVVTFSAGGAA